jgi:hypothetical protein
MSFKDKRLVLLNEVDKRAKSISNKLTLEEPVTKDILKTIIELYNSAKVESVLADDYFEAAYHTPITGELEFLIARILYHYSILKKLKWKIYLRRQENSTVPDIRINKSNETISIIEIKAKGGWIQPFLSLERYNNDKLKMKSGASQYDPDELIFRQRKQLNKYISNFRLKKTDLYFFLPTLALVHRKKYKSTLDDYYINFSKTSELPKENFILLSKNKRLDLSHKPNINSLEPSDNFERMVKLLLNK